MSNKQGLTKRQAQTVAVIREFVQGNGYSPSYQEIADQLNVNKSSVAVILKRLETKGHIVKSPYDRSIALTD
mgnify:CR=1 FL=1|jgi:Mn-dependent DtxR family transcriptional regulator|tara:strand:- start:485 stop:700 length:216 start_codon:yes stop_codon:yes gene_type:complete